MSRSGYVDDCENNWSLICWRGAVNSAIKGRRGQAFLKEMLEALDALPEKKLIASELEQDGQVCALGAIGKARGMDMSDVDPYDRETVAGKFGIADALAAEIMHHNDDIYFGDATPEGRFRSVRRWVESSILPEAPLSDLTKR